MVSLNKNRKYVLIITYFSIENISITYANKQGILSGASKEQLYQLAVKNGCDMSWAQWSGMTMGPGILTPVGTIGSIVCVEMGTDIGLPENIAPGCQYQQNLQVTMNISNIAPIAIIPEIVVIVVQEGSFTIPGFASSITQTGVLDSKDVLDAKQQPGVSYKDVEDVQGGNFLTGLSDFFKKNKLISRLIGPGLGIASQFLGPVGGPIAKVASAIGTPLAASLGYGAALPRGARSRALLPTIPRKMLEDKTAQSRRGRGGVRAGGAVMTREELANRLY